MVRRLGLPFRDVDWTVWGDLLDRVHHPARRGHRRAGRQVRRPARRLPLGRRGAAGRRVRPPRARDDQVGALGLLRDRGGCGCRAGRRRRHRDSGGFGIRGIEGKVGAARHARERGIPTLGLCLGLQCMVIEAARHLAGIDGANSAEFDPDTPDPVIATMADQVDIVAGNADLGGTMRLGAYPATLTPARSWPGLRHRPRSPNGTGTASRSTTPTATGWRGRARDLRDIPGRPPGRVHRTARARSTRSTPRPRRTPS